MSEGEAGPTGRMQRPELTSVEDAMQSVSTMERSNRLTVCSPWPAIIRLHTGLAKSVLARGEQQGTEISIFGLMVFEARCERKAPRTSAGVLALA